MIGLNSRSSAPVAVIGGSGFYDFLSSPSQIYIQTPFQDQPITLLYQQLDDKEVYFLPRHGIGHSIPPHMINFKANLFALHKLGISRIIATNAVGSLRVNIPPRSLVILDQFIDFRGPITYFDGHFSLTYSSGKILSGVTPADAIAVI